MVFFNPANLDSSDVFDLKTHLTSETKLFGLALDGGISRAKQLNLSVHWYIGDLISSVPENLIADTLRAGSILAKLAMTDPDPLSTTTYALRPDKIFLMVK